MSPQKKTVHISASRTVTFGAVAKERLRQENDRNYLVAGKGVIAVDRRRWQTAQEFEYRTWMIDGQHVRDDRNRYHRAAFDNYTALASRSFKRGIELGCGPFTNMRHILRYCRVAELHLLDPLLHHYLHHPHRKYTKAGLRVWQRNRGISLPRRQPVVFHNTSIEEFKPASPNQCDLIVMINVLEHCMNAKRVFATIQSLAAPGAFFVFADKYYSATRLPSELKTSYDAGHPLKLDKSIINGFLHNTCTPRYRLVRTIEAKKSRSVWDTYEEVYFIGQFHNRTGNLPHL